MIFGHMLTLLIYSQQKKTLNAISDGNLVEGLIHDHCYDNNYNHREISFYHINVCELTSKIKKSSVYRSYLWF